MAEPLEYLIFKNLQAALQAIAVADGYHFDIAQFAVKLDPNQDVESIIAPGGPRPFVLMELFSAGNPESWEYSEASGEVSLVLPFTVHYVNDFDATDDDDVFHKFMQGVADVERAACADIHRGGRANDTRIVKRTIAVQASEVWSIVDGEIRLIRQLGEPNAG